MPVTSVQRTTGMKKYTDGGRILNYDDDDYSQGYGRNNELFRSLRNDDILKPYKSLEDFRSSIVWAKDVGHNLYVFVMSYKQKIKAYQPNIVENKFDGFVPNDVNGYDLVMRNKLVSMSAD